MTRKTTKHSKPTEKKSKRLSVRKQTLKDLVFPVRLPRESRGGGRRIRKGPFATISVASGRASGADPRAGVRAGLGPGIAA